MSDNIQQETIDAEHHEDGQAERPAPPRSLDYPPHFGRHEATIKGQAKARATYAAIQQDGTGNPVLVVSGVFTGDVFEAPTPTNPSGIMSYDCEDNTEAEPVAGADGHPVYPPRGFSSAVGKTWCTQGYLTSDNAGKMTINMIRMLGLPRDVKWTDLVDSLLSGPKSAEEIGIAEEVLSIWDDKRKDDDGKYEPSIRLVTFKKLSREVSREVGEQLKTKFAALFAQSAEGKLRFDGKDKDKGRGQAQGQASQRGAGRETAPAQGQGSGDRHKDAQPGLCGRTTSLGTACTLLPGHSNACKDIPWGGGA